MPIREAWARRGRWRRPLYPASGRESPPKRPALRESHRRVRLAAIEETRPDVVVTDVRMPPTGTDEGVRVAERLATAQPDIGVVVVSQYSDPGWLSRVFDSGRENHGWVMKERAHSERQLIRAV